MPEPRLQIQDSLGVRVVAVDKPAFTIGRRATSDLVLSDSEVSREHAEIAQADNQHLLRDCGSRYGTFVNGAQITSAHALSHGDRIRFGRGRGAEARFLVDEDLPTLNDASSAAGFRHVAALLEGLHALGGARLLDEMLALVIDAAIEITGAERGFIMLADDSGRLELTLARGRGRVSIPGTQFQTSRKIPEQVFATGEEAHVADLGDAGLAGAHAGTLALGIRHVLCVPLRVVHYVEELGDRDEPRSIGVLYLDGHNRGTLLSPAARSGLTTLAAEAGIAIENARLYRGALEKARMDEELRIASEIQQALLPSPQRSGAFFDVVATSVPSREVGGDFFDYMDLPDGRFGFALGDVTGKGTPAALLSAVLQGIFAGQAAAVQEPNEVIARVNRGLLIRAAGARFATAFYGVLGPDGRLACCNAGHNPPFVYSGGKIHRLTAGGVILGVFADAAYEQEAVRLVPGDTVVVFSDGVSEAANASNEEFGDERIQEIVGRALAQPPAAILDVLLGGVKAFTGTAAQSDDMTALILRYRG
jgi:sigma-B regulation protein RsbU (phosphoserine phosphatase)